MIRRALVDVVIYVSEIVCLEPRSTLPVPSRQRPHAQRRARAATGTSPNTTEYAYPDSVGPGL